MIPGMENVITGAVDLAINFVILIVVIIVLYIRVFVMAVSWAGVIPHCS